MTTASSSTVRLQRFAFRVLLIMICSILASHAAYGQSGGSGSGGCLAKKLRLRIATGGDDLRGGQDNLNIVIFFTVGQPQVAANVNKSKNWPNNSVNTVNIPLNQPVPPAEIRALRLVHIPDGSFHLNVAELITLAAPIAIAQAFQSPDNWDMADVKVAAIGNGAGARIADHGYFRFTGSNPVLTFATYVPANACGSGRLAGNSGSGGPTPALNPGVYGLHPVTGGTSGVGSKYGALTNHNVAQMAKIGTQNSRVQSRPTMARVNRNLKPGPPVEQRDLLTNEKIVQMVASRRYSESALIALIRKSPTKFDLSHNALIGLLRSGVSGNVVQAMSARERTQGNVSNARVAGIGDGSKAADDLNPQPYPPKGTLLTPGGQQTMLGRQANPGGKSALPGVQRSSVTGPGGIQKISPGTIGPGQSMSAQGNVGSPLGSQSGPTAVATNARGASTARRVIGVRENPGMYVAQACAKDSSYRVLFVSGAPDDKTFTVGPQYTIWGCSFGNNGLSKAPTPVGSASRATEQSINREFAQIYSTPFKIAWLVKCDIQSWSDNAIVVTVDAASAVYPRSGSSLAGLNLPAELWLTRTDGQTTIWGSEGGFTFKPTN